MGEGLGRWNVAAYGVAHGYGFRQSGLAENGQKWSSHLQENRGDSIPFKLLVLCVTSELISREKEA